MQKFRKLAYVMVFALAACATNYTKPGPNADYGPVPSDYEEKIKAEFDTRLIDPESARYEFGKPVKAYDNNIFSGEIDWIGYAVEITLNAKNRLGGYTGRSAYTILFKDNVITDVKEGDLESLLMHRVQ